MRLSSSFFGHGLMAVGDASTTRRQCFYTPFADSESDSGAILVASAPRTNSSTIT